MMVVLSLQKTFNDCIPFCCQAILHVVSAQSHKSLLNQSCRPLLALGFNLSKVSLHLLPIRTAHYFSVHDYPNQSTTPHC